MDRAETVKQSGIFLSGQLGRVLLSSTSGAFQRAGAFLKRFALRSKSCGFAGGAWFLSRLGGGFFGPHRLQFLDFVFSCFLLSLLLIGHLLHLFCRRGL